MGTDVHPAPGGHLSVVGDAEGRRDVEVLLVVEHAHHEAVGDDGARRVGMALEEPEGMPRLDDQRRVALDLLEIALDEAVLHPVLADLAGLAVGDELVGVEGDLEVEVVVDHHLEGSALDALAFVLAYRPAADRARGPEAIAVDPPSRPKLGEELGRHLLLPFGLDVAQGVREGCLLLRWREGRVALGRAAHERVEGGIGGELREAEVDDRVMRHSLPPSRKSHYSRRRHGGHGDIGGRIALIIGGEKRPSSFFLDIPIFVISVFNFRPAARNLMRREHGPPLCRGTAPCPRP